MTISRTTKPWPERFWKSVEKTKTCWLWTRAKAKGYGRIYFQGFLWQASRLSWELEHGKIPKGLHVLHRCDNPPCVRPSHLFLGDDLANVRDAVKKGRMKVTLRGENSPFARLRRCQVDKIRRAYRSGASTQRVLASDYAISQSMVSLIVNGKSW